jgi:hypothetical protein
VFLPAKALNGHQLQIELGTLQGDCAGLEQLEVLLRPDDVVHDDAAPTQAEVVHKAFRGAEILYTLRLASGARCSRWCQATTTTPSARRSASASTSTTSWRSARGLAPASTPILSQGVDRAAPRAQKTPCAATAGGTGTARAPGGNMSSAWRSSCRGPR